MKRNPTANVVFLLDVDNALLDNDRIIADLRSHLEAAFGGASAARYWAAFEALRAEFGCADHLVRCSATGPTRSAATRTMSKVQRSGPWDAVGGRVLIHGHKEQMLDEVQRQHPARHYVMVDDKQRLLAAMKAVLGDWLTTVFPRQGHHALDPVNASLYPAADVTIERIGDLVEVNAATLLAR